jgi:hypothetical protein
MPSILFSIFYLLSPPLQSPHARRRDSPIYLETINSAPRLVSSVVLLMSYPLVCVSISISQLSCTGIMNLWTSL